MVRDATLSPDTQFVLRHAGRTMKRGERVLKEYGTPVELFRGEPVATRIANANQVIRETTVEVFVARRV